MNQRGQPGARMMDTLVDSTPMCAKRGSNWCCLLCLRQFQSEKHLRKHVRKSTLHADNLTRACAAGRIEQEKPATFGVEDRPTKRPLHAPIEPPVEEAGPAAAASSATSKLSALEQMELACCLRIDPNTSSSTPLYTAAHLLGIRCLVAQFEKRLKVGAKRAPEKDSEADGDSTRIVDSNRARSMNNQMDWECGSCNALNFARVVVCGRCSKHIGPDTRYLTNRLKELKHERFARYSSNDPNAGRPEQRADGSHPTNATRAGFGQ